MALAYLVVAAYKDWNVSGDPGLAGVVAIYVLVGISLKYARKSSPLILLLYILFAMTLMMNVFMLIYLFVSKRMWVARYDFEYEVASNIISLIFFVAWSLLNIYNSVAMARSRRNHLRGKHLE